MVYDGYYLLSPCGIHASVSAVLQSVGSGVEHNLDIGGVGFEDFCK